MDIKEFAELINGKEYGYPQFTKEEIETAKENGFVIVHGASDDLMEFEGAMWDEIGCYDGGSAWINRDRISDVPIGVGDREIKAIWCGGEQDENGNEITWTYETDIPHETFMIHEDGEPYCRGIVFNIDDVKQPEGSRKDKKILTNADRIRGLTNTEMAGFLCRVKADYQWEDHEFPGEDACGDWEKWLESEVSE